MKIYVINLDRSKKRWESISLQLRDAGLDFERVGAVDGKNISPQEYAEFCVPLDSKEKIFCPQEVTKSELACYLSHKRCWEKLIESDDNYACILEDDVKLEENFRKVISETNWIPRGVDILQIHNALNINRFYFDRSFSTVNGMIIRPFWPYPFGAQGYILSKTAAKSAVKNSRRILGPVDFFLFSPESYFWDLFPTYRLNPAVVNCTDFSSDIGLRDLRYMGKSPFYIRYSPSRFIKKLSIRCRIIFGKSCAIR